MVLSYRHGFHAGNFADVVKHSACALLLQRFHQKPKPFYYLDTHAGGALYNLKLDSSAQKTREYINGIARIWPLRHYPREMEPYLSCLRVLNKFQLGTSSQSSISYASNISCVDRTHRTEFAWHHLLHRQQCPPPSSTQSLPDFSQQWPEEAFQPESLELYPGSSLLAAFFQRQAALREPGHTALESIADRSVLCELHTNEYEQLKQFYQLPEKATDESSSLSTDVSSSSTHLLSQATRSRTHVMNHSAYLALTSTNSRIFLAPAQGRGLVLVDPPYEVPEEQAQVLHALPIAYNRFRQGVFAVWYPIIDYSPGSPQKLHVDEFKLKLQAMGIPKMLCVEFDLQDSIRANKLGIAPTAEGQRPRLPLLDTVSQYQSNRQRGLGMTGTGMIIINPPHGFESEIKQVCEFLSESLPTPVQVAGAKSLQSYRAKYTIEWLTEEQVGLVKAVKVEKAPENSKTLNQRPQPKQPRTPWQPTHMKTAAAVNARAFSTKTATATASVMTSTPLPPKPKSAKEAVDTIFKLFQEKGEMDYIGEPVSQIEHMTQSAMLAEKAGYSKEKIVASLLHDIGHLIVPNEPMGQLGVRYHEKVGGDYLRALGMNPYVCDLVANHPNAKRYLVTINKEYLNALSPASRKTLDYQGGVMSPTELAAFRSQPHFQDYIDIRKMDEGGKVEKQPIHPIEYYRQMCEACITNL